MAEGERRYNPQEVAMHYDLREADVDFFVTFLFGHGVANDKEGEEPWYQDDDLEIEYDPVEILRLYARLFGAPESLFEKYSRDQLEQGFWAIQSCNLDCSVSEIIWDSGIGLAGKEECIRSMYSLFEKFFAK